MRVHPHHRGREPAGPDPAEPQRATGSRPDAADRGQSTVEFALALPALMLFLLLGVQLVVIIRAQLAVVHAAREGARAAVVSPAPAGAATSAARAAVRLADLDVGTAAGGDRIRVEVRSVVHTDVPLVGAFLGDITVVGTATMAVEP